MKNAVVFSSDTKARNNQYYGNSMKSNIRVPNQTPSLIQSIMGLIRNPIMETQERMTLHPMQSRTFVSPPKKRQRSDPPDDMAHTMELFDLFESGFSPSEAFEPTPIREIITPTLLDNVLEATLDEVDQLHSFLDVAETSDLFKVFDDHQTQNTFHQQSPSAGDSGKFVPAPLIEAALITMGATSNEAESLSQIRMATNSPMPKRRRISNDGQPCFRRYHEIHWMEQFKELLKFKDQKGHCLVPHSYSENPLLSRWVKRQRYQYKLRMTGKTSSTMTDERIKKLEDVGFVWSSHEATWYKRLEELKQYVEKHGNCKIPMNYPENPELATWVKCQRRQYRLFWNSTKSSSMTLDRMQILNELGFLWYAREEVF